VTRAVPEPNENELLAVRDLAVTNRLETVTGDFFARGVFDGNLEVDVSSGWTDVPTPAVSGTSSIESKSTSKVRLVPLSEAVRELQNGAAALRGGPLGLR
jgi:hypothetical protein